jgi:outer membrane lipopolysaccharide assembly protein LptE/RlpB
MKNLKWILCVVLMVFLAACGYQFEGGGYINKDVTRVAVKAFKNNSSETGAGIAFTNALIQEILQKTDTKVVHESRASVFLQGTINGITFATLSRSTTESVIERRVSATMDLNLVNKDGEVIWSVKDFTSNEEYKVSSDQIIDESNKRMAVNKIAVRSAEKLISRLMINF